MSRSVQTGMHICKEKFPLHIYDGRASCSCATSRYDAEDADSSRRAFDRPLLSSAPNRAPHGTSDHVSMYPVHEESESSVTRLPASHFAMERPLGHHFSQVSADSARARSTSYSWSPPSTPADPTTPPQGTRSSLPWSPPGATFHEPNPSTEHPPYYPQGQEHPSASPNVNHRELYHPHQYARTAGASGWSQRAPISPVAPQRRISSAQPLAQNQTSYASSYVDNHRRGEYDGATSRGA